MKRSKRRYSAKNKGLLWLPVLLGVTFGVSHVGAISRGYSSTDAGLSVGMIAKISPNTAAEDRKVERATINEPGRVVGVVTTINDSTVTLATSKDSVYVDDAGNVNAYVSDINGVVARGDRLTLSPLNGVLAKLGNSSSDPVFGVALEDLQTSKSTNYSVKGSSKSAHVGKIRVSFDKNGVKVTQTSDSSLRHLGRSLVGKDISEVRVLLALLLFIVAMVSSGVILYGAVSSALAALGRNPLAKIEIRRELLRVMGIAFVVLFVGLVGVYILLWV